MQGTPMAIADAHNNVTNPVNREAFPAVSNSSNTDIYTNGGWSQIQTLAAEAKAGTTVDAAHFIIGAGSWLGTFAKGSY
jgi:hypothetical protein